MKEKIRCCIACILPCGSLDVIRIVHSNGHVEEISGSITAKEIMRAHPKHVLRKPSSPPQSPSDADRHAVISAAKIVVVSPDAELQRGKIYFLVPASSSDGGGFAGKSGRTARKKRDGDNGAVNRRTQHRRHGGRNGVSDGSNGENNENENNNNYEKNISLLISDRYLTEILSDKVATQRDRRRGRVGVWRPHLESISESTSED